MLVGVLPAVALVVITTATVRTRPPPQAPMTTQTAARWCEKQARVTRSVARAHGVITSTTSGKATTVALCRSGWIPPLCDKQACVTRSRTCTQCHRKHHKCEGNDCDAVRKRLDAAAVRQAIMRDNETPQQRKRRLAHMRRNAKRYRLAPNPNPAKRQRTALATPPAEQLSQLEEQQRIAAIRTHASMFHPHQDFPFKHERLEEFHKLRNPDNNRGTREVRCVWQCPALRACVLRTALAPTLPQCALCVTMRFSLNHTRPRYTRTPIQTCTSGVARGSSKRCAHTVVIVTFPSAPNSAVPTPCLARCLLAPCSARAASNTQLDHTGFSVCNRCHDDLEKDVRTIGNPHTPAPASTCRIYT